MSMFGLPIALMFLTVTEPGAAAGHTPSLGHAPSVGHAPSIGHAPSPEEQKAFADGLRLFEAGDARGAERAWKTGYALGHDPAFLVRIGEAEEKAGASQEAVRSFEQYLREVPDASDRADIEGRLRRLEPPSAGPKSGSHGDTPGEFGAVPPSPAPMRAATPDALSTTGATPVPVAASATPASGPRIPQAQDDGNEDLRPIVDENDAPRSRLNTGAWVGAGVTTLLLGVAAFYGASAAEKSGDANRLLTYSDPDTGIPTEYKANAQQFENDVRTGEHDDRVAKGLLIAAGVTALATTVLFIVDSASERKDPGLRSRADGARQWSVATPRCSRTRPGGLGRSLGLCWSF